MSKLMLTRNDMEAAIRQYYEDYETELYKKYDFENADLYFENKSLGYLGVMFVVNEKESEK